MQREMEERLKQLVSYGRQALPNDNIGPNSLFKNATLASIATSHAATQRMLRWFDSQIKQKSETKEEHKVIYDYEKMKKATELFLDACHPNWRNDPNTIETPTRVAKMNQIMLGGHDQNPKDYLKTFPCETQDMVIVKDVPIISYCSHHLAPFYGTMAIAYIPNRKLVGLSKLVRFARCHLKRLQLQENLTAAIADTLQEVLEPLGVMVYIEAAHTCMTVRGIRSHGATTVTSAVRGLFKEDSKARAEFMEAIRGRNNVFKY